MFTGLSPALTAERNGAYVIPWGRVANLKSNILEATLSEEEGGTDAASRFYDWCGEQTAAYV
jgi:retinol dehydrogenase 12